MLLRLNESTMQLLFVSLVGVFAGVAMSIGMSYGFLIGLGLFVIAVFFVPYITFPKLSYAMFIFLILTLEEFPSGYGETAERSIRTPFYSTSILISGIYSTDILILSLISLYIVILFLNKNNKLFLMDKIGICLSLFYLFLCVSVVLSIINGNAFNEVVIARTTGTSYDVNQRGASLIAFFQFKIFSYLFLSYWLSILVIQNKSDIKFILKIFYVAAIVVLLIGVIRLGLNPDYVARMIPLFYHSPSSWLFALFIFYTVLSWVYKLHSKNTLFILMVISCVFMLFILVSFRRTMWVAIMVSAIILLLLLPLRRSISLVTLSGVVVSLIGVILLFTPVGHNIMDSITGRVLETNVSDASTLYRLALFVYFAENFSSIPLFGYGAESLWNKTVSLGYFRTNLENIHSLYFWVLLRTGYAGMLVFGMLATIVLYQLYSLIRYSNIKLYKVIGVCILLALVMLGISGIFNPVYGEARYMIISGLLLALLSKMIYFERQKGSVNVYSG